MNKEYFKEKLELLKFEYKVNVDNRNTFFGMTLLLLIAIATTSLYQVKFLFYLFMFATGVSLCLYFFYNYYYCTPLKEEIVRMHNKRISELMEKKKPYNPPHFV